MKRRERLGENLEEHKLEPEKKPEVASFLGYSKLDQYAN